MPARATRNNRTTVGDPASSERRRRARRARAIRRRLGTLIALIFAVAAGAALASSGGGNSSSRAREHTASQTPTVPPLVDPHNVYAADSPANFSPVVRRDPALVYVPNSLSGTVDVIDQQTLKIIGHFPVKTRPQHVVPSYDLKTLFVASDVGNSLQPVDPATGQPSGGPIAVPDPYNLYFTPDGRYAVTVA